MSIYTQFGESAQAAQVASNRGWSEFGAWVEKQNAQLANALWTTAVCEDVPGLRAELIATQKATTEPIDKDIESVIEQLLYNIDGASDTGIILITNGVAKDAPPLNPKDKQAQRKAQ
jgi:hypothetical protein